MHKQAINMDVWAIQLIHEHGRITNQVKNELDPDALEELEDRLVTIEMILENHHDVDLQKDLKL